MVKGGMEPVVTPHSPGMCCSVLGGGARDRVTASSALPANLLEYKCAIWPVAHVARSSHGPPARRPPPASDRSVRHHSFGMPYFLSLSYSEARLICRRRAASDWLPADAASVLRSRLRSNAS